MAMLNFGLVGIAASGPQLLWKVVLMVLLVISVSDSAWAQNPRACQQPNENKIEAEGLPRNDPYIVYDDPYFDHNALKYQLNTFSDKAKKPKTHSVICLRYEVENMSGDVITPFSWPIAKILLKRFHSGPAERRANVQRNKLLLEPVKDQTILKAFANATTYAEAWTSSKSKASITAPGATPEATKFAEAGYVHFEELAKNIPDLVSAVQRVGFSRAPIVSYFSPTQAESLAYDDISNTYVAPGISITVTSSAAFDGKTYDVSIIISTDAESKEDLTIRSPYLKAIGKANDPVNLIDLITKSEFSQLENRNDKLLLTYYAPIYDGSPQLFEVEFPIIIGTGEDRECFLASAYSRFPVSQGLDACEIE